MSKQQILNEYKKLQHIREHHLGIVESKADAHEKQYHKVRMLCLHNIESVISIILDANIPYSTQYEVYKFLGHTGSVAKEDNSIIADHVNPILRDNIDKLSEEFAIHLQWLDRVHNY